VSSSAKCLINVCLLITVGYKILWENFHTAKIHIVFGDANRFDEITGVSLDCHAASRLAMTGVKSQSRSRHCERSEAIQELQ
jgi:hypothetical protein